MFTGDSHVLKSEDLLELEFRLELDITCTELEFPMLTDSIELLEETEELYIIEDILIDTDCDVQILADKLAILLLDDEPFELLSDSIVTIQRSQLNTIINNAVKIKTEILILTSPFSSRFLLF